MLKCEVNHHEEVAKNLATGPADVAKAAGTLQEEHSLIYYYDDEKKTRATFYNNSGYAAPNFAS